MAVAVADAPADAVHRVRRAGPGKLARESKRLERLLRWRAERLQEQQGSAAAERRVAAQASAAGRGRRLLPVAGERDVFELQDGSPRAGSGLPAGSLDQESLVVDITNDDVLQAAVAAGVGVFIVQDARGGASQLSDVCRGLARRGFVRNRQVSDTTFDFK